MRERRLMPAVSGVFSLLPGMRVTITSSKSPGSRHTGETAKDGFAEFWLPRDTEYSIEVVSPGFKRRHIRRVKVGGALQYTSTAYVQVQLQVGSPKVRVE